LEGTTAISYHYCNSDTLIILDGMDGELDLVSDYEARITTGNLYAGPLVRSGLTVAVASTFFASCPVG